MSKRNLKSLKLQQSNSQFVKIDKKYEHHLVEIFERALIQSRRQIIHFDEERQNLPNELVIDDLDHQPRWKGLSKAVEKDRDQSNKFE